MGDIADDLIDAGFDQLTDMDQELDNAFYWQRRLPSVWHTQASFGKSFRNRTAEKAIEIANTLNRKWRTTMLTDSTVWADKRGIEHDLQKMSDAYIINIMAFLTRSKEKLTNIEWDNSQIDLEVSRIDTWIERFSEELIRRETLGITIDRQSGCEYGL